MMKRTNMHVVLTPSWYPDRQRPHNGSFFRDQAQMLKRAGIRVGVIALEPVSIWQVKHRLRVDVEEGIIVVRGTVPTVPKGILPGDRMLARFQAARAVFLYEAVAQAMSSQEWSIPDVVHAHSVFTGIHVGLYAAQRWNAGLAVTEHRPSSTDRSKYGWRYRALCRDLRQAGGRAVVSTPFAEVLEDYWEAGPWKVIALPVNNAVFDVPRDDQWRKDGGPLTVCHVSHLGRNKRPEETVIAVARLARADRAAGREPTRLLLVGGEPQEVEALRVLAQLEGIGETSTFTGRVPHEEVALLMAGSDIFVLASEVEAGGTVLAEAQALGLACIVTPTWAGRFMVKQGSGIVLPAMEDASGETLVVSLVEGLAWVSEAIRVGRLRSEAIRSQARDRFSEEVFVATSQKLYEQAIEVSLHR